MNTQDNSAVTVSFVDSFQSYAADSKAMGELKTRLEDTRKVLEPVIRAHKIPIAPKAENNKAWKEKRTIFFPLVQELEWPRDEVTNEKIEKDDISQTEMKRMSDRITAWLGVIRTCLEYQILPTDKNADRLRKAKVWTGLNGNGKMNPNWVDPNAPKAEPTVPTDADEKKADAIVAAVERQINKEDDEKMRQIGAVGNALALATMQRGAGQTTPKAPSAKPATPQKAVEVIHPLTSNVSSSDAPLTPREHFKVLFNQLTKNETFREEYCSILALMLDVEKSTLTRCMVQAADEVKV